MEQIVARACNAFVNPAGVIEGIGDVSGSIGIAFITFKILSPWEGADGLASRGESHSSPLVVVAGGGHAGDVVGVGRETGKVAGKAPISWLRVAIAILLGIILFSFVVYVLNNS